MAADRRRVLLFFAFVTLAINLRGPITAISPVIATIRTDLAIDAATAGFLTSLPVLCFAVATPFAAWVLSRVGVETGVLLTLGGLFVGVVVRSLDGFAVTVLGTVILGVAITIGNIVALMIIMRDFFRRRRTMTAIDVFAMSLGAMICAAFTAPLAEWTGWRFAAASWSAMALVSIALWVPLWRKRRPDPVADDAPAEASQPSAKLPVWRRPTPWLLGAAFGAHTFMFYGLTAWLPRYLVAAGGMSVNAAGFAASLFQIFGLAGSFGVPAVMAIRGLSRYAPLATVAAAWLVMPLGLLFAPDWWLLWLLSGGYASGGGFAVIFTLIMERADGLDDNRRVSAFVQGTGYSVAAISPTLIGYTLEATGGWALGFGIVAMLALAMFGCAAAAIARK